jgi:Permuted papain-like amidase enzyme, YaeF/YiiX, C92 family
VKHTALSLSALALALAACGAPSMVRTKPSDPARNRAVTAMWARDISRVARDGDWILTRSYSAIGDVIAFGTRGPEISHSSIYDAERGVAIEAIASGVHEVPLAELLERNRVAIVVRPHGLDDAARRASVLRARSMIGREFDSAGLFGFDSDERFYCSELVVWAAGLEIDALVITPASLVDHGEVIYLSGNRESLDLQEVALAQEQRQRPARVAANLRSAR